MRIWKQVTLAVIFAIVGIAFTACDNGIGSGTGSGTNVGERIIGTWVDDRGDTWVFNANGNLTRSMFTYKFGIINTTLAVAWSDNSGYHELYDVYISPNGRTLILTGVNYYASVLTKQ